MQKWEYLTVVVERYGKESVLMVAAIDDKEVEVLPTAGPSGMRVIDYSTRTPWFDFLKKAGEEGWELLPLQIEGWPVYRIYATFKRPIESQVKSPEEI